MTPRLALNTDPVPQTNLDVPLACPAADIPLAVSQQQVTDNLDQLVGALPDRIQKALPSAGDMEELLEIVLDLGRIPEARFTSGVVELSDEVVTAEEIDYVIAHVGAFGKDNRAGIERTLHRISAIRNRQGRIVGLTCRIGRAVYGTIDIIQDIVEAGKSILMLGRPGRGKTTKLREVARILSDQLKKRVVIVDTSNEIAGDGDIPHPAIGRARRMQVAEPELQHNVMIEAVENHMPEVIVIDEIGTEQEAFAARTIAERGVQLVGTAHGNTLENLMMNPTLSDLVGGIHAVTLSDDEAKRRGTQKTVLERKAPPTFDVVIEIIEVDKLAIHVDVAVTVDRLLRGTLPRPEIRVRTEEGQIAVLQKTEESYGIREIPDGPEQKVSSQRRERSTARTETTRTPPREDRESAPRLVPRPAAPPPPPRMETPERAERLEKPKSPKTTLRIFPYGVSRSRMERAIAEMRVPAFIARDVQDADVVLALKSTYQREPGKMREANQKRLPIYTVKSNTYAQIAGCVREVFGLPAVEGSEENSMEIALVEAQEAIEMVKATNHAVDLAPANSYTRRLQHQLAERYQLVSESVGVEPQRRVRILPITA
jgi:stage III sporulation protein SpoIIIAA